MSAVHRGISRSPNYEFDELFEKMTDKCSGLLDGQRSRCFCWRMSTESSSARTPRFSLDESAV